MKKTLTALALLFLSIGMIFSADLSSEKERVKKAVDIMQESAQAIPQHMDEPAKTESTDESPDTESEITVLTKNGVESKCTFSVGALALLLDKASYKSGGNHFSPVKCIVPIPLVYASFNYTAKIFANSLFPVLTMSANSYLLPVSLSQSVSLSYAPFKSFPLFSLGMGGNISTGLFGNTGVYNPEEREYEAKTPFSVFDWKAYANAQLLLPLGKHLLVTAGYEIACIAQTGATSHDLWGGHQHNGFGYTASLSTLCPLPFTVNAVGILASMGRYFSDSDLDDRYLDFDGTFTTYAVLLLATAKFNEHNSLALLVPFSNRRSFATDHDDANEEPLLETTGSEWYWAGLILKYTHTF